MDVKYWREHSIPKENHYFFVYYITIVNHSAYTVQLLKRHWEIFDSVGDHRQVDGEGVVGECPVLEPGERYQYNSGCNLISDMGNMKGYYVMTRLSDGQMFNVSIPKFDLVVPAKLN